MTLPPEAYLWFKTLHIVGVVVWLLVCSIW